MTDGDKHGSVRNIGGSGVAQVGVVEAGRVSLGKARAAKHSFLQGKEEGRCLRERDSLRPDGSLGQYSDGRRHYTPIRRSPINYAIQLLGKQRQDETLCKRKHRGSCSVIVESYMHYGRESVFDTVR